MADEDDYFDYERPLDFVSRAERRSIMKEAGGDEEKANQLLVERANAEAGTLIDKPEQEPVDVVNDNDEVSVDADQPEIVDATIEDKTTDEEPEKPKSKKEDIPKPKKSPEEKPPVDDDDLDVLGLDDF